MMEHPAAAALDRLFQEVFEQADRELERRHGDLFPLHPSRPDHGTTANPQMDGLYNLGASFTAGYGSQQGRGLVIDLRFSTLSEVPREVREKVFQEALDLIRQGLKEKIPQRSFTIAKDGEVWKITGDFSLGATY